MREQAGGTRTIASILARSCAVVTLFLTATLCLSMDSVDRTRLPGCWLERFFEPRIRSATSLTPCRRRRHHAGTGRREVSHTSPCVPATTQRRHAGMSTTPENWICRRRRHRRRDCYHPGPAGEGPAEPHHRASRDKLTSSPFHNRATRAQPRVSPPACTCAKSGPRSRRSMRPAGSGDQAGRAVRTRPVVP